MDYKEYESEKEWSELTSGVNNDDCEARQKYYNKMENEFDKQGFIEYLEHHFSVGRHGFKNSFLRNTIENIIDYGLKYKHISKDQLCYWLSDMIAEVEFGEVAMFVADESLTTIGQKEKQEELHLVRKDDKND